MSPSKKELYETINADIYRNTGRHYKHGIIRFIFKTHSPLCFIVRLRLCRYYYQKKDKAFFAKLMFAVTKYLWKKESVKLGFEIDYRSKIGKGLRLPHRGSIVVHKDVLIGDNCEKMQCVTIGSNIVKSRTDVAVIRNNVMLCAGSKIIGKVSIGDNVIIGANSVVNKDIESNVIAAGVTAKIVKHLDKSYAVNCDY